MRRRVGLCMQKTPRCIQSSTNIRTTLFPKVGFLASQLSEMKLLSLGLYFEANSLLLLILIWCGDVWIRAGVVCCIPYHRGVVEFVVFYLSAWDLIISFLAFCILALGLLLVMEEEDCQAVPFLRMKGGDEWWMKYVLRFFGALCSHEAFSACMARALLSSSILFCVEVFPTGFWIWSAE